VRVERLFNPIKIILETPEEVQDIERALSEVLYESRWHPWHRGRKDPTLEKLLQICRDTSKRTDFK